MLDRNSTTNKLNKAITSLETANIASGHIGEGIAGLVESLFDAVFDSALAGLKKVIPWIVTLGPAIALYTSLVEPLAASEWLTIQTAQIAALTLSVAFESLGLFITRTLAVANDWNRSKNKSDPEMPTAMLKLFLGGYVAGGMVLVLSIKGWGDAVAWFYASMFIVGPIAHTTSENADKLKRLLRDKREQVRGREILSGIAAKIKVVRGDLDALDAQVEQSRQELYRIADEVEKKAAKLTKLNRKQAADGVKSGISPITNTSIETANQGKRARLQARRERIAAFLEAGKTDAEIRKLEKGISQDTLRRDKRKIADSFDGFFSDASAAVSVSGNGHQNGQGVNS